MRITTKLAKIAAALEQQGDKDKAAYFKQLAQQRHSRKTRTTKK